MKHGLLGYAVVPSGMEKSGCEETLGGAEGLLGRLGILPCKEGLLWGSHCIGSPSPPIQPVSLEKDGRG